MSTSAVGHGWTLRQLIEQFPDALDKPLILADPDQRGYAFTLCPAYEMTVMDWRDNEHVMLEINGQELIPIQGLEAGDD